MKSIFELRGVIFDLWNSSGVGLFSVRRVADPKIGNRQSAIKNSATPAFALGPTTAALILATQHEFQRETQKNAPVINQLLRGVHRLRITRTDARIVAVFGIIIIMVHLFYIVPRIHDADARMAEAVVNYQQGQLTETMAICRRYPDPAVSRFLRANLMMLTENFPRAEELYHQALRKETGSPSALFGYALALQTNEKYKDAIRRYNDFIDIYETELSRPDREDLVDLAYEFLRLAEENFNKPPRWKRVYAQPIMNDLGL